MTRKLVYDPLDFQTKTPVNIKSILHLELASYLTRLSYLSSFTDGGQIFNALVPADFPLKISMEEENENDISLVVNERLQDMTDGDLGYGEDIASFIIKKSKGIFQWAKFVAQTASEESEKKVSVVELRQIFENVPQDLGGLYKRLLTSCAKPRHTLKLFRWILFAMEPLSLEELREAITLSADMRHFSVSHLQQDPLYIADVENMPTVVNNLSQGLVEIQIHEGRQIAQFIHQSVPDYLTEFGLKLLEDVIPGELSGRGHFELSRSCLKYLRFPEIQAAWMVKARLTARALSTTPLSTVTWEQSPNLSMQEQSWINWMKKEIQHFTSPSVLLMSVVYESSFRQEPEWILRTTTDIHHYSIPTFSNTRVTRLLLTHFAMLKRNMESQRQI
ncbi:hypothetical protein SLS54_008035 [Diplodia seriata]